MDCKLLYNCTLGYHGDQRAYKENGPQGHLVWILMFDDQYDHLD
jgi:hypothetical protein